MASSGDDLLNLRLENQRLKADLAQVTKWCVYLERSMTAMANGLAGGLKDWVEALSSMSPLNGGDGESLVEPD